MRVIAYILLASVILVSAACSRSAPEAKPVDYQKLCGHLIPLFPESGRESFAQTCEASYRRDLPTCRNASAVVDCFMDLKSWDGRTACANLCTRHSAPEK